MPEQTTQTTTTESTTQSSAETETASAWTEAFKGEDPAKVRQALDHAREWEKRAKENVEAAKRLAEIEAAKKTEAEKAAERIANLEQQVQATQREALKRHVQAKHKISDEDADLFLTGADEETLEAQAKRLAEREAERKKNGNRVTREGTNNSSSKADPMRELARSVFGRDD